MVKHGPDRCIETACLGKQAFTAEDALKAQQAHQARKEVVICRYRCPFCGAWHIGGKGGAKLKRMGKLKRRGHRK